LVWLLPLSLLPLSPLPPLLLLLQLSLLLLVVALAVFAESCRTCVHRVLVVLPLSDASAVPHTPTHTTRGQDTKRHIQHKLHR
jgi:hypothetical protein